MRNRAKQLSKTAVQSAVAEKAANGAFDGADDVGDRICATLAAAISEGALKPGSKIPEDTIADHFGVSRTVVRGALGVLQSDHLLERKRNRGRFVAAAPSAPARGESSCSRPAGRRAHHSRHGGGSRKPLWAWLALTKSPRRKSASMPGPMRPSKPACRAISTSSLRSSAAMASMELLGKVVARLSLVMALYETEHSDECLADEHLAIVAALRRSDLAEAQRLMDEHLADIEGRVRLT